MTDLSDIMKATAETGYKAEMLRHMAEGMKEWHDTDWAQMEVEIRTRLTALPLERLVHLPKERLTHILEIIESLRAELEGGGKPLAERRKEIGL